MSWAKIDDRLFLHPKFLQLSVEAQAAWLRMLSYAAGLERDGWFPDAALTVLSSALNHDAIVVELLRANLWLRDGDGYRFHDYLKYNPSRKQLIRQRKKTARRVKALRARNGVTSPLVTRLPARPGPTRPKEQQILAFARTRATRAQRATTWPDDFRLTDERASLATEQRIEMPWEWNKFKDHHRAKGSRFVDWDAAWRTWIRNAVEFAERRGRG